MQNSLAYTFDPHYCMCIAYRSDKQMEGQTGGKTENVMKLRVITAYFIYIM